MDLYGFVETIGYFWAYHQLKSAWVLALVPLGLAFYLEITIASRRIIDRLVTSAPSAPFPVAFVHSHLELPDVF